MPPKPWGFQAWSAMTKSHVVAIAVAPKHSATIRVGPMISRTRAAKGTERRAAARQASATLPPAASMATVTPDMAPAGSCWA